MPSTERSSINQADGKKLNAAALRLNSPYEPLNGCCASLKEEGKREAYFTPQQSSLANQRIWNDE